MYGKIKIQKVRYCYHYVVTHLLVGKDAEKLSAEFVRLFVLGTILQCIKLIFKQKPSLEQLKSQKRKDLRKSNQNTLKRLLINYFSIFNLYYKPFTTTEEPTFCLRGHYP
jgi:membrane-anchored protein YejM (alkaline phosphatase superfamily)